MVKKILAGLTAAIISLIPSAQAQNTVPGLGWSQNGTSVSSDQPFLMTSNQPGASNERALDVGVGLTKTDNGANADFIIGLGPVLSYWYSTGATTQQAAANAVLDFPSKAAGDLFYYNGTNVVRLPKGANSTVVGVDSGGTFGYYSPAGGGTVTDFALGSWPGWLTPSVTLSTSTPTLAVAMTGAQTANRVLATPNGTTGAVGLRALVAGDIPNLDASKINAGNLAKAQHATTAVFNDQSNTYTGTFTQNFGASTQTLVIPIKSGSTTTGEISLNSTDLQFRSAGATHLAAKQATTISAGTGLTGGGSLAANRTISLATVPGTLGGTGLTTTTVGGMLQGAASNTYTMTAIGANGTAWKSNGTTASWQADATGFGGGGQAGSTSKGTVAETTQLQLNATDFTQTVSTTWQPLSGTIVNATTTCAFNGTTTVGTGCAGGALGGGNTSTVIPPEPAGISPGSSGTGGSGWLGGGGGGAAGAGGRGGTTTTARPGGGAYPISMLGGSGGGYGNYGGGTVGGIGGNGGGCLIACSIGAMTVGASGTINANGAAGAAGTGGAGGGGGGGGGTVSLNSQASIVNSGAISAVGGAGANDTAGGGGGGGGYIQFVSPSNTNGTRTVTGGAAGTGNAPVAGSAGLAVSITATPNLPLLLSMQEDNFARMKSIALAHRVLNFPAKEGFDVELSQREAAQACSRGSVIQFAKLVDGNMEESTCIEIGDAVEALDNAA